MQALKRFYTGDRLFLYCRLLVTCIRMSTFLGIIEEIPGISVDRFDGENLNSSVFFLSHAHCDHEKGLGSMFFLALSNTKRYLYCTAVTKLIVQNKYGLGDSDCIKEIDVNSNTIIQYELDGEVYAISVACISAGHSLGSVMFIFESNQISILYTGDFRINPDNLSKLKLMHHSDGSKRIPKKFTKIYLDTTFLTHFTHLPTRQESLLRICDIVQEWFGQDPTNVVSLECSHNYGSEFLYVELSKFFGMKIHVKDKLYKNYRHIFELKCHVTDKPLSTNIHACKQKQARNSLNCRDDMPDSKVLTIIPSVQKWRDKDTSIVGEWDQCKKRTYNVCYSTHSSYNEIKAFLNYFGCSNIHPCVYEGTVHEQAIQSLLNDITGKSNIEIHLKEKASISNFINFKCNPVFKSSYTNDDEDSL